MSGFFASKRQQVQRLGRILRPKDNGGLMGEYNAYFYTLISKDTDEAIFMDERQQILIN